MDEHLLWKSCSLYTMERFLTKVAEKEDHGGDLRRGWNHLQVMLSKEEPQDRHFLSTELICEIHRVIFEEDGIARAGRLSSLPRKTFWKGAWHWYPHPDNMEVALDELCEGFNVRQFWGCKPDQQCAWFLVYFLALHPFSDGNGRVAHVLASNILQQGPIPFCDHPDFVESLIRDRNQCNHESTLAVVRDFI